MLLPGEISRTTRWFRRSQQRPVCHEQSIVKYFGALRMMREGPSEPAFRRRFQTAFMLLSLKDLVVSDKGKGPEVKESGTY